MDYDPERYENWKGGWMPAMERDGVLFVKCPGPFAEKNGLISLDDCIDCMNCIDYDFEVPCTRCIVQQGFDEPPRILEPIVLTETGELVMKEPWTLTVISDGVSTVLEDTLHDIDHGFEGEPEAALADLVEAVDYLWHDVMDRDPSGLSPAQMEDRRRLLGLLEPKTVKGTEARLRWRRSRGRLRPQPRRGILRVGDLRCGADASQAERRDMTVR